MPAVRTTRTYTEQLQHIIEQYIEAGNAWPAPMKAVATWACDKGLFQRRPPTMIELCSRDLARAARQEYITDPQGRRVRRLHAFRKEVEIGEEYVQTTFWTDILSAQQHSASTLR